MLTARSGFPSPRLPCLLSARHPPSLVGGRWSPWGLPSLAAPTLSGPLPSSLPLRHLVSRQFPARLDTIKGGGMTQDHVIIHFSKTRFLCTWRNDELQSEPCTRKPELCTRRGWKKQAQLSLGSLRPGPRSGNCLTVTKSLMLVDGSVGAALEQYPPTHTHTHSLHRTQI